MIFPNNRTRNRDFGLRWYHNLVICVEALSPRIRLLSFAKYKTTRRHFYSVDVNGELMIASSRARILKWILLLVAGSCWGQTTLSLASGSGAPGGTVALGLTFLDSGHDRVSGLQWILQYPPASVAAVTVSAAPALAAASKSLSCAAASGKYTCVVNGPNAKVIPNGLVATAQFTLSANPTNTNLVLAGALAASAPANAVPVVATGGTISVPPTLVSLTCSPTTLSPGSVSRCSVVLSQAAPAGGAVIGLTSGNKLLVVPASVTVSAGATTATFTMVDNTLAAAPSAAVTATLNGSTQSITFTLVAPATQKKLVQATVSPNCGIPRAAPAIYSRGVVNTASSAPGGPPDGSLAPGSLFTIYGSGLGPDEYVKADGYPFPKTLGGVSVQVKQGSARYDAGLLLASSGQVNAILPSDLQVGEAQVMVRYNGDISAPATIAVSKTAVGVFQHELDGRNLAIAQNLRSATASPLNLPDSPAKPGEIVDLWVTGVGPAADGGSTAPLTVNVGGVPAERPHSGPRPEQEAIDHIFFTVPSGIAFGCQVPVAVTMGGMAANLTAIAVTPDGSPCK